DHRHVRPADRDDQQNAEGERDQLDEPEREVAFAADEHDEQDEQATARPILMAWRCGSMIGLPLIRPSSLRKAMTEPVKVMVPMAIQCRHPKCRRRGRRLTGPPSWRQGR